MLKTLLSTILLCAAGLPALAQSSTGDPIDAYVQNEMAKEHIPGLELGIYKDGKIVRAQGYGLANVELNVAVKPETIFQSGSVGKQFTATAVMMLVEEGKIGLEDSVRKYFPEAPDTWQQVKIKNLLSHTSGLSEYESPDKMKPGGPINLRADLTEDSLVKIIEGFPMDFRTGEKWAYRNTNYVLLGVIIHKITGKFYGDFLQERIFQPLGMKSTRIISDADIIPNRSAGYQWVKGELKNQDWVSPFFNSTADGALYFNVLDLAKWDEALYGERLLKRSSLDQMWTVFKLNDGKPNSSNYGFAWEINDVNGHKVIEHSGAWQGFTTHIARYVDDKVSVVVLTNLDAGHAHPSRIAHHVAGLYQTSLMAPEHKPIADSEPQTTARLRKLLDQLSAGTADPNDFSAKFRTTFFPDEAKALQEGLRDMGALNSFELMERKDSDDGRVSTYRVTFADTTVQMAFTLDREGKLAALDFKDDE